MADVAALLDTLRERVHVLDSLGYRVRFDLTDAGTSLMLDATGGTAELSEQGGDADAVLKLSGDTLEKLVTGRIGPLLAFSTGRLKVEGSQGVALKLAGLLDEA